MNKPESGDAEIMMGMPGTDSVLIILTVPDHFKKLSEPEIARKLRQNEPHITNFLAKEIKRWAGVDAVNLTGLQEFLDARMKP